VCGDEGAADSQEDVEICGSQRGSADTQ